MACMSQGGMQVVEPARVAWMGNAWHAGARVLNQCRELREPRAGPYGCSEGGGDLLHPCCTHIAPLLHSWHPFVAPLLHSWHPFVAPLLHPYCTLVAPLLHSWHPFVAPLAVANGLEPRESMQSHVNTRESAHGNPQVSIGRDPCKPGMDRSP